MVDIVGPDTFGGTWEAAVREAPDRDFLVYLDEADGRATYTYGQFDRLVRRTAAGFAACGIGYQTIVALQVGNSPEFVSCFLALARLGAVVVPLGLKTPAPELRRLYDTCGATWAIVEAATQDLHAGLRDHAGYLPGGLIVAHGEAAAGALALDTLGTPTAPVPVPPPVGSDDLAELLFTSGTTATPKAVMITHANLVYSGHFATWQASLRGDDRVLTTMPACHSNFQLVALTGVIVAQATLVLAERYSARRFWAQVRTERATVIQLTAMMARTLLLQPPAAAEREHLVRETLYFMPLSTTEKTAFEARYGVRFMNSYGSTESICWVVTDPPVGGRRWPAVGRAALGYEVAITDEAGRSLPPGQVGEFRIKGVPGRTLMAGYWRDPAATRAALT
ncbi:MAG: AMP-binding protein, partial [Propionibacteriaceae bacterium]|nr:AMP-binding protein [Propionibacteriaceae bacterium]